MRLNCLQALAGFHALALVAIAVVAGGCQGGKGSVVPVGERLPNLPRASAVLAPGQGITWRDLRFEYVHFEPGVDGAGDEARIAIQRGNQRSIERWAIGGYRLEGDALVRVQHRDAQSGGTPGLLLFTMTHLPSVTGPRQADPLAAPVVLREGEATFFAGGFVALESVADNDYHALDDDRARLVFWLGGELEDWTMREFHARPHGRWLVGLRDVFTGHLPGDGVAVVEFRDLETAWDAAERREQRLLPPGTRLSWEGVSFMGDYLELEDGPRGVVSVERADRSFDTVAREGEWVRLGRHEVVLEEVRPSGLWVSLAQFADDVQAVQSRTRPRRESPAQQAARTEAEPQSRLMTRRLRTGETIEFWDARFEMVRAHRMDPTRTTDNAIELMVTWEGQYDSYLIRQGSRQSIQGQNRWWIVVVEDVQASGTEGQGEAMLRLQTGGYFDPVR
ncbi:MAG: hypothetical protein KF858_12160 [Candidatus Sumerlaeia bacterium]|nr:hypothetical protein [Candidatus Sumerlaeia bacterium]